VLPLFKEALHNILRHAHATRVNVHVGHEGNQLHLTISDNGCGFDSDHPAEGNGLKNMRRRARDMNGRLKIARAPTGGTTIHLVAPLP
jgi:signal transduction histidine kinase